MESATGQPFSAKLTLRDEDQKVVFKNKSITKRTKADPSKSELKHGDSYVATIAVVSATKKANTVNVFNRICKEEGARHMHGDTVVRSVKLKGDKSIAKVYIAIVMKS